MKKPKLPKWQGKKSPPAKGAAPTRKKRATRKPNRRQRMQLSRPWSGRKGGWKAWRSRSKAKKAKKAGTKQPAKKARAKSKTTGLWFRASTRVRAAGYWLREKGQVLARLVRADVGAVVAFWGRRSTRGRIQIGAVAAIVVLYSVLKFVPVAGVPCSFSAVNECAPPDDTVALVPAGSLLYAHATLDGDTTQSERTEAAFGSLSELERVVVGGASASFPAPSGAAVDLREDVLPWAEQDLAVMIVPGAEPPDGQKGAPATPGEAFIAGVGDRAGAEEFLAAIAPEGAAPTEEKQGEATLDVYSGGFAAAFVEDQVAFGDETAVRSVLDAASGTVPSLEGSPEGAPRDDLSESRFAEVFISRDGVKQLLTGRVGPAAQLETFVDYGATSGLAAAVVAKEEGLEVELVSQLEPKLIGKSPSFFSSLPEFEPNLASAVGDKAIGYIGVGELGPTFADLIDQADPDAQGLAGSLRALAARLRTDAGVDPLADLLPALGGQAALVAEPTEDRPFASLIVEGVDEDKANEALARLQAPLLKAAGAGAPGGQVPQFSEEDVDGVTVRSVPLSAAVNLSYAVFDGRLVISTSPQGVAQARSGEGRLADSGVYKRTVDRLPDEVSALVFLNLDELFGQVVGIGLAEDPDFADLTVLFENANSVGLAVNGDDERIRTELFLDVD